MADPAKSKPRRVARTMRLVRHPLCGVAALLVFSVCVALLPINQFSGSVTGLWLHHHVLWRASPTPKWSVWNAYVKGTHGWLNLLFSDNSSETIEADRLYKEGNPALFASLYPPQQLGWFAPTTDVRDYQVRFLDERTRNPIRAWTSDADRLALRELFLDWVAMRHSEELATHAALARSGDRVESRTLWLGHLHNAVAALSLLIALIALPPAIWRAIAYRRPTPGRCACGYDLTGLRGPNCPECGAPIASANAALPPRP